MNALARHACSLVTSSSNPIWIKCTTLKSLVMKGRFDGKFLMGSLSMKLPKMEQSTDKSLANSAGRRLFFLKAFELKTPHQCEAKIRQGFLRLYQTALTQHRGLSTSTADKAEWNIWTPYLFYSFN